jgi:hypothetical protein
MAALDRECFVHEQLVGEFACMICLGVPRAPAEIGVCGHLGCRACLETALKHAPRCPVCKQAARVADVRPNAYAGTKVAGLKIGCRNRERGCVAVVTVGKAGATIDKHEATCGFGGVTCDICGQAVLRKDHAAHDVSAAAVHTRLLYAKLNELRAENQALREDVKRHQCNSYAELHWPNAPQQPYSKLLTCNFTCLSRDWRLQAFRNRTLHAAIDDAPDSLIVQLKLMHGAPCTARAHCAVRRWSDNSTALARTRGTKRGIKFGVGDVCSLLVTSLRDLRSSGALRPQTNDVSIACKLTFLGDSHPLLDHDPAPLDLPQPQARRGAMGGGTPPS